MSCDSEDDEWSGGSSSEEEEDTTAFGVHGAAGYAAPMAGLVAAGGAGDHDGGSSEVEEGVGSGRSEEEEDSEEDEDGSMLDEYEAEQMRMLKLLGQVVRKRLGEGHPETVYAHVSSWLSVCIVCLVSMGSNAPPPAAGSILHQPLFSS